jgi:hypothetical protein
LTVMTGVGVVVGVGEAVAVGSSVGVAVGTVGVGDGSAVAVGGKVGSGVGVIVGVHVAVTGSSAGATVVGRAAVFLPTGPVGPQPASQRRTAEAATTNVPVRSDDFSRLGAPAKAATTNVVTTTTTLTRSPDRSTVARYRW